MSQQTTVIGKIGIRPRGQFDSYFLNPNVSNPYKKLDLVTHNGRSYLARRDTTQDWRLSDDFNEDDWQLLITAEGPSQEQVDYSVIDYLNNNTLIKPVIVTAAAFDSTATYSVGNIVIYDNKIYSCTTAIESAAEWASVSNNFSIMQNGSMIDNSLSISGAAADAYKTGTIAAQIGVAFNSANSYKTGDFVIYQDKLYRATTDMTANQAFDSRWWSQDNLTNGIIDTNNKTKKIFSNICDCINQNSIIQVKISDWELGTISAAGEESNTSNPRVIKTGFFPIQPNTTYTFTGATTDTIHNKSRLIMNCFYDKNFNFISRIGSTENIWGSCPTGTAYVRFLYGYASSTGLYISNYSNNGLEGLEAVAAEWSMNFTYPAIGQNNINTKIVNNFAANTSYLIDEYVQYNGNIYRSTETIPSTQASFNSSNWTEVTNLANEINNNKQDVLHLFETTSTDTTIKRPLEQKSNWEIGDLDENGFEINSIYTIRSTFIPFTMDSSFKFKGLFQDANTPATSRIFKYYTYDYNLTKIGNVNTNYESSPENNYVPRTTAYIRFVYGYDVNSNKTINSYSNNTATGFDAVFNEFTCSLVYPHVHKTTYQDSFGPIIKVAETYFNAAYSSANTLVYSSGRGLFRDTITAPIPSGEALPSLAKGGICTDTGVNAIVCSQFVEACLYGIDYQHSRYVQDTNERASWGYVTDHILTPGAGGIWKSSDNQYIDDYMIAANLAKYCQEHGWLYEIDTTQSEYTYFHQLSQMKPGDLIFYENSNTSFWNNIGHVAFCLQNYKTYYSTIESGTFGQNNEYGVGISYRPYKQPTGDGINKIKYFARMPLSSVAYSSNKINRNFLSYNGSKTFTSDIWANNYISFYLSLMDKITTEFGFYTFILTETADFKAGAIQLIYNDNSTQIYYGQKINNDIKIVFYLDKPIYRFRIFIYPTLEDDNSSKNKTYTYNLTKYTLYRGYVPFEI